MDVSLDKYKGPDKRVQFEVYWVEEYDNDEYMAAYNLFGCKTRIQGGIVYINRSSIGGMLIYPSSKYVESEDTSTVGRL